LIIEEAKFCRKCEEEQSGKRFADGVGDLDEQRRLLDEGEDVVEEAEEVEKEAEDDECVGKLFGFCEFFVDSVTGFARLAIELDGTVDEDGELEGEEDKRGKDWSVHEN
jgi:hypothetical protein